MASIAETILGRLDMGPDYLICGREVETWPAESLGHLTDWGILQETRPATTVICDECPEHCLIDLDLQIYPNGKTVGVYRCFDEHHGGRIEFDRDNLRQWSVSLQGLARYLAKQLQLAGQIREATGQTTETEYDRIYSLGKMSRAGRPIDVFLARGLRWKGAPDLLSQSTRLHTASSPVLLCPRDIPTPESWPGWMGHGHSLTIIALAEYAVAETDGRGGDLPLFDTDSLQVRLQQAIQTTCGAWLTVTQCAELLLNDVSGIDLRKAKARVSKAATTGKFRTNNRQGQSRRIDHHSFSTWRLEQREKDLANAEW